MVRQFDAIVATAAAGALWGTITSEPGSGGDILRTRTLAVPGGEANGDVPGAAYRLSGDKHFGSGSGVTSFMITTAVAEGEDVPAFFVIDVRDRPWDGSAGVQLIAEWDGMGMAATQSHAMRLEGCPAIRHAWDGPVEELTAVPARWSRAYSRRSSSAFSTRRSIPPSSSWRRRLTGCAPTSGWSGRGPSSNIGSRCRRTRVPSGRRVRRSRQRAACHAAGEGSRRRAGRDVPWSPRPGNRWWYVLPSVPVRAWFEDVRALGFLRPPWGLAYDALFGTSFA